MKEVLADIERWRARGEKFALATVVATRRSAPRPVGAKLAISESGEMAGSVSGGCVESDVYEHACEVLEGSRPQLLSYGITDELALSVGLPCGGEIDVFVDRSPDELVERLVRIVESEERAVLFTVVEGEPLGAELLVSEAGEQFGNGPQELADHVDELLRGGRNRLLAEAERKVFAEVYGPAPRLLVIGAVDTAEELCALARQARLAHGRRRRAREVRDHGADPERPRADRRLAAGRARPGRAGLPDGRRRPHPRRQVRHPGDPGRPRDGRVLHRRARLAPEPGAAPRAAARGRRRGARARPRVRPVRPRHRSRHACRDRTVDPRRDPRYARPA